MRLVVLVAALSLVPVMAASADPGHHHQHGARATFSAGAPGNPRRPARTVQVSMGEADGKMLFSPGQLQVRRGEQVRFLLKNGGELEHEFVLATTDENTRHAVEMAKDPHMAHDEPNARRLTPKASGEILWQFTQAGEFEYACLIPGHREAGMTGKIVVK